MMLSKPKFKICWLRIIMSKKKKKRRMKMLKRLPQTQSSLRPERRTRLSSISGLSDRRYPLIMIGRWCNPCIWETLSQRVRVKKENLNGKLSMITMEGGREWGLMLIIIQSKWLILNYILQVQPKMNVSLYLTKVAQSLMKLNLKNLLLPYQTGWNILSKAELTPNQRIANNLKMSLTPN